MTYVDHMHTMRRGRDSCRCLVVYHDGRIRIRCGGLARQWFAAIHIPKLSFHLPAAVRSDATLCELQAFLDRGTSVSLLSIIKSVHLLEIFNDTRELTARAAHDMATPLAPTTSPISFSADNVSAIARSFSSAALSTASPPLSHFGMLAVLSHPASAQNISAVNVPSLNLVKDPVAFVIPPVREKATLNGNLVTDHLESHSIGTHVVAFLLTAVFTFVLCWTLEGDTKGDVDSALSKSPRTIYRLSLKLLPSTGSNHHRHRCRKYGCVEQKGCRP
ncbi:hypothetical protein LshimejAT787_1701810 [Lyophyllum shimeji]|uniref:Uncharacterized protein n=1 Tax=Lyophyllum shimeji TaxID=47721 RepID=A0A9P3PZP3_LYOSH|nr:hypothetical protein LshimejAT787_1701810 [Lyophyllum shimeji]